MIQISGEVRICFCFLCGIYSLQKFKAMLLNIFSTIKGLPMVWDFIAPLAIIAIFCAVLFWAARYGKFTRKHYRLRFKGLHHH